MEYTTKARHVPRRSIVTAAYYVHDISITSQLRHYKYNEEAKKTITYELLRRITRCSSFLRRHTSSLYSHDQHFTAWLGLQKQRWKGPDKLVLSSTIHTHYSRWPLHGHHLLRSVRLCPVTSKSEASTTRKISRAPRLSGKFSVQEMAETASSCHCVVLSCLRGSMHGMICRKDGNVIRRASRILFGDLMDCLKGRELFRSSYMVRGERVRILKEMLRMDRLGSGFEAVDESVSVWRKKHFEVQYWDFMDDSD